MQVPQFEHPLREGAITGPDGSRWSYEIGLTGDARLLWVLRAPDRSWRSQVAAPAALVGEVEQHLHELVSRWSTN